MTTEGFAKFATIIKATYSRENILNTPESMAVWMELLEDIPDDVAMMVLKTWCAGNKWSPAISDIREGAVNIVHGEMSDWGSAWETVLKAISRFGRYQEAEAMASLDDLTRECVENIGFKFICNAEEEDVGYLKKDFEKLYTQKAERKRRQLQTALMIEGNADRGRICG